MRCLGLRSLRIGLVALCCAFTQAGLTNAQNVPAHPASEPASVNSVLRDLQAQIQQLNQQIRELREQQKATQAETAELRRALEAAKSNAVSGDVASAQKTSEVQTAVDERLTRVQENQQMQEMELKEQSQTKVESGSKYRVRLSGMVLFNLFGNAGTVDNEDFPTLALPNEFLFTGKSFGGSVRQSDIGIEAFGPTLSGARTSADVHFDFAGGFPQVPNGTAFGIVRLKTATVRFDWQNTSIIGGQDTLFFSPLTPTSLAMLAVPALSYAGNLWSWTPQVRVEHKLRVSDSSVLQIQAGILDSFSGDIPDYEYGRDVTWGEDSGQPAYATRLAWTEGTEQRGFVLGAAGYYGRQHWGFGRSVDSWAGIIDLTVPMGAKFAFNSEFHRGRALAGIGGGIGQDVFMNGSLATSQTGVHGVDSLGGWSQFKYRATTKLQFNAAYGLENPFAGDLRQDAGSRNEYGAPIAKNQSAFVNFIYQPRSDILFSFEYRRLLTSQLDVGTQSANHFNLSVGYMF